MFWGIINAILAFLLQISIFSFLPIFGFYPNIIIIVVVLGALFFRRSVFLYSVLFSAFLFEVFSRQMSGLYVIWAAAALALVIILKKNIIRKFNALLGLLLLFVLEGTFMLFSAIATILSGGEIDFAVTLYNATGSFVFNILICSAVYASQRYLYPKTAQFI